MPFVPNSAGPARPWTLLTNHALVLLCLAADPHARMRDVAAAVGITGRGVQRIVAELAEDGYLAITRVGRRNRYTIDARRPLRHPLVADRTIRELLKLGAGLKLGDGRSAG